MEGLEAQGWAGDLFDKSMILFDDIVEILHERWSQDFGPVVKMDRLMRKTVHNDETKEPWTC